LLIPKDRIGVVKDKEIREAIEKNLNVKLSFKENLVEIDGESLDLFKAKNVVKSIGRGFSPEKAFRLFDEEESLKIIDLSEYSDKKD